MQLMSLQLSTTRKKRQRFLNDDLKSLEEFYQKKSCPTGLEKEQLAEELGTSKRRIQVWFQNRRAKAKRQTSTSALMATTTPSVSRSNDFHTESTDHVAVINNPVPNEFNAPGMTELTPSAIHAIPPRSGMAQVFVCQPSYAIDTAGTDYDRHHSRYYGHSIYFIHPGQRSTEHSQNPHITHALPTFTSMQYQPSSFRPSSQPMAPIYLHDGPSGVGNRQNHPTNYVSVLPNPTNPYFLSHENQQPQHLRHYHHRHHQPQATTPPNSSNAND